jgi:hypothetical protein
MVDPQMALERSLPTSAKKKPSFQMIEVEQLPKGWLGKNHAMHLGSQIANGDYLLFTDADVVFAPDTL